MNPDLDLIIQRLKHEYGDIFGIELDGVEYIYRSLTLDEINKADQLLEDTDREDFYAKSAVLFPDKFDIDNMRAGDVITLAEAVMSVSGILDVETVKGYLIQARESLSSDVITVMKSYIIAAMPSYREEELNNFTMKQLIAKLVLAEQILTLQQVVMGLESDGVKVQIMTTEEYKQATRPASAPKSRRMKKTREELLREMKNEELDTVTGRYVENQRKLQDVSDDLLEKMSGKDVDPSDPVAAKLFGLK